MSAELETALGHYHSISETEDIVTAVEEYIFKSSSVQYFGDFLIQIKMVNRMFETPSDFAGRIDNEVFREWCDAVTASMTGAKTTLPPIVSKLSDMRNVNAELEYMIAEPRKEFMIMVVL